MIEKITQINKTPAEDSKQLYGGRVKEPFQVLREKVNILLYKNVNKYIVQKKKKEEVNLTIPCKPVCV